MCICLLLLQHRILLPRIRIRSKCEQSLYLVRTCFLVCMNIDGHPLAVYSCGSGWWGISLRSFWKGHYSHTWEPTPSWPNYPPNAPSSNAITLGVRISTCESGEDLNIQSVAQGCSCFQKDNVMLSVFFFVTVSSPLICSAILNPPKTNINIFNLGLHWCSLVRKEISNPVWVRLAIPGQSVPVNFQSGMYSLHPRATRCWVEAVVAGILPAHPTQLVFSYWHPNSRHLGRPHCVQQPDGDSHVASRACMLLRPLISLKESHTHKS